MIQRLSFFFFFLLITFVLSAQSIKGIVLSKENKEPLPYASVYIMNSSIGTYCNEDGQFEIKGESNQFILVVSLIGFENQKVGIDARKDTFVTILLKESVLELNEAVVEGKKENVGKSIMRKVIANKPQVLSKETRYSA
ncbi:MAG: carboxypeptidase-like regulatory domain-containing protein, partial [Bacteroidota bacterium]